MQQNCVAIYVLMRGSGILEQRGHFFAVPRGEIAPYLQANDNNEA